MTMKERLGDAQPVDAVGDNLERVDVEAGIELIQHGKPWLEHRHLQNLVALLLAAGEADIDGAAKHRLYRLSPCSRTVLRTPASTFRLAALLAMGIERGRRNFMVATPGISNGYWKARNRPAAARSSACSDSLAAKGTVPRYAHSPACQRALGERPFAGAVGTHDRMYFAGVDGEVEAFEISLPSISACRFLISSNAIKATNFRISCVSRRASASAIRRRSCVRLTIQMKAAITRASMTKNAIKAARAASGHSTGASIEATTTTSTVTAVTAQPCHVTGVAP